MDEPQLPPEGTIIHNIAKYNPSTTPLLEHIPSFSSSHAKASDASHPEDGDTKMFLDEQDLVGINLDHLEQAYHKYELYTIPKDQLHKVDKVFLKSSAR
jgi:hypothetical protein